MQRGNETYPRTDQAQAMLLACTDLIAPQERLLGIGAEGVKRHRGSLETAVRAARALRRTPKSLAPRPSPLAPRP